MYRVMYAGQPLGVTQLEGRDPQKSMAYGTFLPLAAYDHVRPIFWLFAQALRGNGRTPDNALLAQYYRSRDALHLTLESERGVVIPTVAIQIIDMRGVWDSDGCAIEVWMADSAFFDSEQEQREGQQKPQKRQKQQTDG